ncbi:MAG: hypothetical protein WC231_01160 [Dehalococcoidales bacterium]
MSLDPVNIDFIIGGNVDSEGKKVEGQVKDIGKSAKQAKAEVRAQIRELEADMKATLSNIKILEKELKNLAPGKNKSNLQGELQNLKQGLEVDKETLLSLKSRLDQTATAYERLSSKMIQAKDTLAKLEAAGMRGTEEWKAARAELEQLGAQMKSVSRQAQVLSDPNAGFHAVTQGVSGLAGAMSAAVGTAALFGAENEELARIQTRLQAAMAITIGIQQVATTLQKDSYFSVKLLTKAKHLWAAANLKVATTLGISTVAAKALMATLTLGLSVAITGLVVVVDKLIRKNKEQKKAAEEAAKAQRQAAKEMSDAYGKEMAKVETLRAALNSENISRDKKLNIIKQLKSIIPGYTAELDKEGRVIRENKTAVDNYILSLEKSIKLKAKEKELSELFAKKMDVQSMTFERPKARTVEEADFLDGQEAYFNQFKATQIKEIDDAVAEINKYIQSEGLIDLGLNFSDPDPDNKEATQQFDAAKAIGQQLLEINKQTARLLFDQREENLQKTLDAITREEQEEIEKIKEKEQKIIDEYNKAGKDKKGFTAATSLADIDPELAKQNADAVLAMEDAYNQKRKNATKSYTDDIIKLAKESADDRVRIANDYEEKIKKAREMGLTNIADQYEAERKKKISDTTAQMIAETDIYKVATNEQLKISKETTEKLIEDIRKRVEAELEAKKITKEKAQEILDSLSATGMGKESANNPFKNLIDGLAKYKKAKESLEKKRESGAGIGELANLEAAANETLESTALAAASSLKGVHDILSAAVDGLNELGLLSEEEKQTADQIVGMVGGAADLAMGIASGNPMQMIQGAIQLVVNGIKLFDKKSKDIEKAQKQHKKNIQDLEREYKKLERDIGKALGTDVYKKQREQLANLQKQIDEYYKLIEQEEKKKKKKQDQNQINEWKDKIDELKAQSEDVVDNIVESLTQTSARDLASQLADSIVSAFRAGEDAAEAMGRTIDDVIRQAVINSLKLRYLEKPLEKLVNQFADDMESGGELTKAEADRFRQGVESLGGDFTKALEMANQALGGIFQDAKEMASPQGIKGDVANMSEQTGSALVGQLTAMRLNVASLAGEAKRSGESMTQIFASLERIKDNTEYCRLLERIDDNIQYLKVNGMTVK